MLAILHSLGMFVADLFKSRCLLEAENRDLAGLGSAQNLVDILCGSAKLLPERRQQVRWYTLGLVLLLLLDCSCSSAKRSQTCAICTKATRSL